MIVPLRRTRWPSKDSEAAPVSKGKAAGRSAAGPGMSADSEIRRVRCENLLETDPSTVTVVPAGHMPTTGTSR